MNEPTSSSRQHEFERLIERQEAGVAQVMATFEAVERAYFAAVAATPQPTIATTHATTTAAPR